MMRILKILIQDVLRQNVLRGADVLSYLFAQFRYVFGMASKLINYMGKACGSSVTGKSYQNKSDLRA